MMPFKYGYGVQQEDKMGQRRRRDEGLLTIALSGRWPVAASMAGGTFIFGFVVVPRILGGNPRLAALSGALAPIVWLFVLIFGGVALVKYLGERRRGNNRHSDGVALRPPGARQTAKRATRFERVEPVIGAPNPEPGALTDAMDLPPRQAESAPVKPTEWSLEVLRDVEWKRFEDLCAAYYREKGIQCATTPLGADGGVDVRLYQDDKNPEHCTAIVQCKAWGEKYVGVKPVRELRGVMAHEKIEKAFFMAPGGYSDDAKAFARENRISLLDGKLFLAMLQRLPAESRQRLLAFATEGDWTTPTCPSCGVKMAARSGAKGRFWGCANYPKCRQILGMRGASA